MSAPETVRSTETSQPRGGIFYGWVVLFASFVVITVVFGIQNSFAVFFKPIQAEFGLSRTVVSGAASLSMFLGGTLGILVGRFADRHGPRRAVLLSGAVFGAGLVLLSFVGAVWQLYLVYGLMVCMGMAGGYAPLASAATRWFVARRGLAVGIIVCGMGFGTLVLPPISERLVALYDWRGAYLGLGIIAAVLVVAAALFLRRDPGEMGLLPDGKRSVSSPASQKPEAAGRVQVSSASSDDLSVAQGIRTRAFWLLMMMFAAATLCLYMVLVHMFQYITDLRPGATAMAALMQGLIGGVSLPGKIVAGMLADRFGPKRVFVVTMIVQCLSLLWLTQARTEWTFIVFAIVFGISYGGWGPVIPSLAASYFGLRNIGAIMGFIFWGATTGGTLGPILAGLIFDSTQSYSIAFTIAAGIALASVLMALLLPRRSYIPGQTGEVR